MVSNSRYSIWPSMSRERNSESSRSIERAANKLGAKWVVLLNAEQAARRIALLREMSSGDQTEMEWVELPTRLA